MRNNRKVFTLKIKTRVFIISDFIVQRHAKKYNFAL